MLNPTNHDSPPVEFDPAGSGVTQAPDPEVVALIERGVKKSRSSDRLLGLAVTFAIAGSVGGIGLVVSASASKELAESERALCQRVPFDRLGMIKLREDQEAAVREIARGPALSAMERSVRLAEAAVLQASTDDLRTRADPANGGTLVCADEFPDPGVFG